MKEWLLVNTGWTSAKSVASILKSLTILKKRGLGCLLRDNSLNKSKLLALLFQHQYSGQHINRFNQSNYLFLMIITNNHKLDSMSFT